MLGHPALTRHHVRLLLVAGEVERAVDDGPIRAALDHQAADRHQGRVVRTEAV